MLAVPPRQSPAILAVAAGRTDTLSGRHSADRVTVTPAWGNQSSEVSGPLGRPVPEAGRSLEAGQPVPKAGAAQRSGGRSPSIRSFSAGNCARVAATFAASNSTVSTSSPEPASPSTSPHGSTTIE